MNSIELTAPAKVNLLLKVLNKRKDSYHNLLTVFERISLADRIKISRIEKGIIVTCDRPVTANPNDNIAYKAAELILKTANVNSGVRIHIVKRIPMAAGLGGGSSDAASVLTGINKLFRLRISKAKLMRLGAKLGADVPFFIFDTPFAIGRGMGDKLEKLKLSKRFCHLVVYPGWKMATKDVYGAIDASKPVQRRERPPEGLTNGSGGDRMARPKDLDSLGRLFYNDLERVVTAKKPIIGKIVKCLASSPGGRAMVSGSGSSVFYQCNTRKEAIAAKEKLFSSVPERLRRRWQVFIAWTKV